MSAGWPGMTGPTDHVRVGTRSAGEGTCPDYLAAKAHPALWPATSARARKEKLDTFPLGILNAALDEVERNGATAAQAIDLAVEEAAREGKRPHPAALTWVRVGVAQYLAGAARYRDQVQPGDRATVLVRDYWVAREDHRESGGRLWEMYAYGRRYESPDGSVREIRLLHYGTFDPSQSAEERQGAQGQNAMEDRKLAGRAAQEAMAAYSAAFGVAAPWPRRWSEPFQPSRVSRPPAMPVSRVRVVQVGLADGEHHVVFKGSQDNCSALTVPPRADISTCSTANSLRVTGTRRPARRTSTRNGSRSTSPAVSTGGAASLGRLARARSRAISSGSSNGFVR